MIKRLTIQNFQSHKNSTFEFNEGLNVIIGKTDSGKSAIRRAINWVIKNKPSGNSICSWWGGVTKVQIEFFDGNIVSRIKEGTKNLYVLNDVEFTAFGTSIPQEIQDVINMNDINLQAQFDAPYLLSSSPGEVASHFNKIAHISQINTALQKINSWTKAIEKTVDTNSTIVIQAKEQLKQFEYLEQMEMDLEVTEELEQQLTQLYTKKQKLIGLINDIKETDIQVCKLENSGLNSLESDIFEVLQLYKTIEEETEVETRLTSLISNIKQVNDSIQEKEKLISFEIPFADALSWIKEKEKREKETETLSELIEDIKTTETQIKQWQNQLINLEISYKQEYPKVCPFCNK